MAKIVDTLVSDEQASAEPMREPLPVAAAEHLKFRDKVYTSRQLIVPDTDHMLPVSKGVVSVPASDTEAVKFLKANEEFELLKE
jgi:hypothetical protein